MTESDPMPSTVIGEEVTRTVTFPSIVGKSRVIAEVKPMLEKD